MGFVDSFRGHWDINSSFLKVLFAQIADPFHRAETHQRAGRETSSATLLQLL